MQAAAVVLGAAQAPRRMGEPRRRLAANIANAIANEARHHGSMRAERCQSSRTTPTGHAASRRCRDRIWPDKTKSGPLTVSTAL
jgi:hypothetical protein